MSGVLFAVWRRRATRVFVVAAFAIAGVAACGDDSGGSDRPPTEQDDGGGY